MANSFNSEVGQANKSGGHGVVFKRSGKMPAKGNPSLSTVNWPGLPGKTGPSRGSLPTIKVSMKSIGI